MIKILCLSPDVTDFTSFCRAAGPLNRLSRDFPDKFRVVYGSNQHSTWPHIQSADVVMVQRPHTAAHFELCKLVRLSSRKLWIDFDDHYFEVPEDNLGYEFFCQKKNQEMIKAICGLADLVTVSTPLLLETYRPFVSPISYIMCVPNGYDSTLFDYHREPLKQRQPILWMRGSKTHYRDVAEFATGIVRALDTHQRYNFLNYGFMPWVITNDLPRNRWGVRTFPMMNYFYDSWEKCPSVMVVPLHNNPFNVAKSNVAAIEGAMTGSIVVAPKFLPEFVQLPGVVHFGDSNDSIQEALEIAMNLAGTQDGWKMVFALRNHIIAKLELGRINEMRSGVLELLVSQPKKPYNGPVVAATDGAAQLKDDESQPLFT